MRIKLFHVSAFLWVLPMGLGGSGCSGFSEPTHNTSIPGAGAKPGKEHAATQSTSRSLLAKTRGGMQFAASGLRSTAVRAKAQVGTLGAAAFSFSDAVNFATGAGPYEVAVGDVDGDCESAAIGWLRPPCRSSDPGCRDRSAEHRELCSPSAA